VAGWISWNLSPRGKQKGVESGMTKSKLIIILGIDFDQSPVQADDPLFTLRMGPRRFLEFLEIHCGILPVTQTPMERTAAFMTVLKAHQGHFPFFASSWEKSPFAAARKMLEWLDYWYLHGWNGSLEEAGEGLSSRDDSLEELSFLEKASRLKVAAGTGRRLLMLRERLDEGVCLPVNRLILADPLEDWPEAWHRVFDSLPFGREEYSWGPGEIEAGESHRPEVEIWEYQCASTALRYLASLSENIDGSPETRFILGKEGFLRDELLSRYGRPQTGCRGDGGADGFSQILPLALSLRKEPLDVGALLAFLSLADCPLGRVRHGLARAVADSGGIHGHAWRKALKDFGGEGRHPYKKGTTLEAFIDAWIPRVRCPEEDYPLDEAQSVAQMVKAFLERSRTAEAAAALYRVALFIRVLEILAESYDSVSFSLLNQFLHYSSPGTADSPLNRREAGAPPFWTAPGAVFEDVSRLIWFCPDNRTSRFFRSWSDGQIAILEAQGCRFPSPSRESAREFRILRRGFSRVKDSLVLIVPAGRTEMSPAEQWLRYGASFSKPRIRVLEKEILSGGVGAADRVIQESPLPPLVKKWKIRKNLDPGDRWRTSYSQTDTFITRPAQWLLDRKARIRTGTILALPEPATFRGTCSHRMVEMLFNETGDRALMMPPEEYSAWFDRTYPLMLENHAFPYLARGAEQERIRFHDRLKSSLTALLAQLKQAGARQIEREVRLKGHLFGAAFEGFADLVFQNSLGRPGIIDMKYSGWLDGYIQKMEKSLDIQLTIYAELYRQSRGVLPETAYWLFPRETLLSRSAEFFPGSRVVNTDVSHKEKMAMIGKSIEARRRQLKDGLVEIVCAGSQGREEAADLELFALPPGGLPGVEPDDRFDPYLPLYGWEEEA